ncbi:hypothetical protein V1477_005107 [Vespula maculifrons]|uniref:Uncharacterized protein n=2 Tax=Vespula TaxID=7451 RepID=A0A834KMI3_VESVU|nr:hypothetical protein HZH66_002116 [Vespula vulgaris]
MKISNGDSQRKHVSILSLISGRCTKRGVATYRTIEIALFKRDTSFRLLGLNSIRLRVISNLDDDWNPTYSYPKDDREDWQ